MIVDQLHGHGLAVIETVHHAPVAGDADGPLARAVPLLEMQPSLDTVPRVVGALGLKLRAEAVLDSDVAGQGAPAHR